MSKQKCAVVYGPVPGTNGGKWLCIAVDGNMRWNATYEAESEADAKQWAKRLRAHWRKYSRQVCCRLSPNAAGEARAGLD